MNKKIFRGAILESIFLNLINDTADQGLHGYSILQRVHKKFGVLLGPSSIYPELKQLEKQGLISSSWEYNKGRPCKRYRITQKGQRRLSEDFAELKTIIPVFVTCKTEDNLIPIARACSNT